MDNYRFNVFINCPFDIKYRKFWRAISFAIIDCGFNPRCALESDDSSTNRLERIFGIIEECRFGVHDISRTTLDTKNRLPRFNMPLELGMFLSAKHFGTKKEKSKRCIVFDKDQYRYQKFISDIAGADIKAHNNSEKTAVIVVRNWLSPYNKDIIPGGSKVYERYTVFSRQLPRQCKDLKLVLKEINFGDFVNLAAAWIEKNTR